MFWKKKCKRKSWRFFLGERYLYLSLTFISLLPQKIHKLKKKSRCSYGETGIFQEPSRIYIHQLGNEKTTTVITFFFFFNLMMKTDEGMPPSQNPKINIYKHLIFSSEVITCIFESHLLLYIKNPDNIDLTEFQIYFSSGELSLIVKTSHYF